MVTDNILTIRPSPVVEGDGIPDSPLRYAARSCFLDCSDRLQRRAREVNEEPLFAIRANAAAGTLKTLNSAEVARH